MNGITLAERLATGREWPKKFPPERWAMYKSVLADAEREGVRLAVGGGLAAALYGGVWRDSKDIDLYIQHSDLDRMRRVLDRNGLCDYFRTKPYDRRWIYRTFFRDTIVDVMWAMANQRAKVDPEWLTGPEIQMDGQTVRLLRPEETLWTKLYVMQFDRCDWPDALNILYTTGDGMDWDRMERLVGEDRPLLRAVLDLFAWVCPGRASALPKTVWERPSGLPRDSEPYVPNRANLLDTRPWLTPMALQAETVKA